MSALPFVGVDVPPLVLRFCALGRAAIVGPHGAGKSTLMRSIGETLRARGTDTLAVAVPSSATPGERANALAMVVAGAADPNAVVLLDGYEQMTWPERHRVRSCPRLLVTAHRRTRLTTLVALRPTLDTLNAVLAELGVAPSAVTSAAFARHRGDVRETLMTLFDAWGDGAFGADNS